jgi:hypothetical protein
MVHRWAISPVFYPIVKAWTELVNDEVSRYFFHYPGHFLHLPYFYGWARLVLSVIFEGLFLGTVAHLFARAFARDSLDLKGSFGAQVRMWGHLVLAGVVLHGFLTAAFMWLPELFAPWLYGSPRMTLGFQLVVLPAVYVVILALFFYTIPSIALYRLPVHRGIWRSLKLVIRRPLTSLFLSFAVVIVPVMVAALVSRPDMIVRELRPEVIFWLLAAGLAADLVSNFFWMGTSTRLLLAEESALS